jgi:heptosyltransferase-3
LANGWKPAAGKRRCFPRLKRKLYQTDTVVYSYGIPPNKPQDHNAHMSDSRYGLHRKVFHYDVNHRIRQMIMRTMSMFAGESEEIPFDPNKETIEKILLVRATYRIGESVLATPAISLFRSKFPRARIDFVGGATSKILFQNLPIDHHYQLARRFPQTCWAYPLLLKQLQSVGYDLAIDLSCSQSAMGAFIVRLSRARFRIGRQGKWDHWFNVRLPKPGESNKYMMLPAFLTPLGLGKIERFPSIALSAAEKEAGKKKIAAAIGTSANPVVGVFVGGRLYWGKRWAPERFVELIKNLSERGAKVVIFFGPEESELMSFYKQRVDPKIPMVAESSLRNFAAMIASCQLFVTCDSGPMHLACAMGVRTVAIFIQPNANHWGPPPELGRIAYQKSGVSSSEVLDICVQELRAVPGNANLLKTG